MGTAMQMIETYNKRQAAINIRKSYMEPELKHQSWNSKSQDPIVKMSGSFKAMGIVNVDNSGNKSNGSTKHTLWQFIVQASFNDA